MGSRVHKREKDIRGNNEDRARRRAWMWEKFAEWEGIPGFRGGRFAVEYHWCHELLNFKDFEVDRWPIAGKDGGTYRRDNIVPACRQCNAAHREQEREHMAELVDAAGLDPVE